MKAYELYACNHDGEEDFIGILPERRKKRERITQESILKWGRKVIGDNSDVEDIYFILIEY
jgi:hypothetical protein